MVSGDEAEAEEEGLEEEEEEEREGVSRGRGMECARRMWRAGCLFDRKGGRALCDLRRAQGRLAAAPAAAPAAVVLGGSDGMEMRARNEGIELGNARLEAMMGRAAMSGVNTEGE